MAISSSLRRWSRSQFLQNVARISSGRMIAMAVAIAATPVVSRLFDPADYGVAAIFIATIGVLASVTPLSYERAVLFPKEDETSVRLLTLALVVSILVTVFAYAVIATINVIWPDIESRSGLGGFLWAVPAGALLLAVRRIFATACIRDKYFSSIAFGDVGEAVVAAGSRIAWGLLLTSSALGLILGYSVGLLVAAAICGFFALRKAFAVKTSISPGSLADVGREYRDYPYYRAPAKLAFTGAQRMPVIALGILFPVEVAGFYAMANRAAAAPLYAASQAVKDVLLQKIMGKRQEGQPIVANLGTVVVALTISGIPVFLTLFLFGEEVLGWFLGDRWAAAGRMAEILAPYLFLVWVGSFTATVFESLRLNKLRLKIQTANLFVRLGIFTLCFLLAKGVEETLWVFVSVSCVFQVFVFWLASRAAVQHDRSLRADGKPNVEAGE